jgi:serine/threonine protein kinase
MFIQMVRGLRCLHEIMIFHRDLKSANVFLNKDSKHCFVKAKLLKQAILMVVIITPELTELDFL